MIPSPTVVLPREFAAVCYCRVVRLPVALVIADCIALNRFWPWQQTQDEEEQTRMGTLEMKSSRVFQHMK